MNRWIAAVILLLCCGTNFAQADPAELAKLFQQDVRMAKHRDFAAYRNARKGISLVQWMHAHAGRNGAVLIVAEAGIYDLCGPAIDRYIADVESGLAYGTFFYTVTPAVPAEDIKALMCNHYTNDNISGAVLIGDVNTAWYEIDDDFGMYGYTYFPIDLFYMDLDGLWLDADANGRYEAHEQDVDPEIFVGRINTEPMQRLGDEASLLNQYLDRNHLYWLGNLQTTGKTSLSYTDHDWAGYEDMKHDILLVSGMDAHESVAYGDGIFCRADYLDRVGNPLYGMVQFACHSSWEAHYMTDEPIITTRNIHNLPPQGIAYNLFCCSGCRWTAPTANDYGFLGGVYVYNSGSHALFSIGSSKTGSMLGFADYYRPLGQGKTNGMAFKRWWIDCVGPTHDSGEISWFYGMTIVGDPLVCLVPEPVAYFAGGAGSAADPFLVENAGHLYVMRYFLDNHYKQNATIDFADTDYATGAGWWPVGSGGNPFQGSFNGNGHTIANLMINRPGEYEIGLFGQLVDAQIDNVFIHGPDITGGMHTGGLAGSMFNSAVNTCYVHGGSVSGSRFVGGLAGDVQNCVLDQTINAGEVAGTYNMTGGLVGMAEDTEIINSCNTGPVMGGMNTGGLAGSLADGSSVISCYSMGSVIGTSSVGGLIGSSDQSVVTAGYWDTQTSGQAESQGGEGRTTEEMTAPHAANTYVGWDFDNLWRSDDGHTLNNGYPLLRLFADFDLDLAYFTAAGLGQEVTIAWGSNSEQDIIGFNLYRIVGKKVSPYVSFAPVRLNDGLIPASGGSGMPGDYSFTDYVKPSGKYFYVLEAVSRYRYTLTWKILMSWESR